MTKQIEKAEFPGCCFICGERIYTGDIITRGMSGITPIAMHVQCDPSVHPSEYIERSDD